MGDSVRDALELIARQVQAFLNGKTGALHELCDILVSGRFSESTVKEALETIIELAGEETELDDKESLLESGSDDYDSRQVSLTPEAQALLTELRSSGALNVVTERAVLERVAASTTGEVGVEDLRKAMEELVADPYSSFLISSDNPDSPTIH